MHVVKRDALLTYLLIYLASGPADMQMHFAAINGANNATILCMNFSLEISKVFFAIACNICNFCTCIYLCC